MRLDATLASVLATTLLGCGGSAPTGSQAPADGAGAKTPATAAGDTATPAMPATPAKAVMGGDSPADVVKRAQAAAAKNDAAALLCVVEPTERKATVVMLGLMPQLMRMLKPMLAMMGGMAGGMAGAMGDAEAAKKAKAEAEKKSAEMVANMDKLILEMDGVCKAHKVDLPSMEELAINPMAGDPDPKELLEKIGTRLDHVDETAFVTAMSAAMDKLKTIMPEGKGGGPVDDLKAKFGAGTLADLKETGDAATGTVDGKPVEFCRVGGRWYLKGLLKKRRGGPAAPPADEGMGKDGGADEGGGDDGGEDG
jgi:hypothetical protein